MHDHRDTHHLIDELQLVYLNSLPQFSLLSPTLIGSYVLWSRLRGQILSWSPTFHTMKLEFSFPTVSSLKPMVGTVTVSVRFERCKHVVSSPLRLHDLVRCTESGKSRCPFADLPVVLQINGLVLCVFLMRCGSRCVLSCSTSPVLTCCSLRGLLCVRLLRYHVKGFCESRVSRALHVRVLWNCGTY